MKTVATLADLRRLALVTGAEVEVNGQRFNSGRAQISHAPAKPTPPAPQAEPPPVETLTRVQVEQMLAQHNARITEQFGSIIAALKQPASAGAPKQWDFEITYGSQHEITNVTAKAKP